MLVGVTIRVVKPTSLRVAFCVFLICVRGFIAPLDRASRCATRFRG